MQCLNTKPFTSKAPVARAGRPARALAVRCSAQQKTNRVAQAAAVATVLAAAPAAQAAELFDSANVDAGTLTFAVGGGAAIAGLGALLIATDPQNR